MATNNSWNSSLPAGVSSGGTGAASLTAHGVLVGEGTSAITALAVGTTGQVLTGTSASDPAFAALGTNSGLTAHGVLLGENNSAIVATAVGTNGQILVGASAADPGWVTPTAGSGLSITTNSSTLSYAISAPVSIANGGTNATSMTNTDGVVYYDGTRLVTTAVGSANQVLTSNGAAMAPTFQAVPSSSITITGDSGGGLTGNSFTFTGGTSGLTFAGAGSTETLGGTLIVANGGTGRATLTNHGVLVGAGTSALTQLSVGSNGQVLVGSSAADPVFATLGSSSLTYTTGAGTLSIDITAPVSIANGGTDATSFSTSTGMVKYDGTRLVTSSTAKIDSSNRTTNSSQPAFFAFVNSSTTNNTGDGTAYTVVFNSTLFDQNSNFNTGSGTFTAPVTGKYMLTFYILGQSMVAANTTVLEIVTTANTFIYGNTASSGVGNNPFTFTVFAPMSANDTATCQFIVSGGTKSVGVSGAASSSRTAFHGYLVC